MCESLSWQGGCNDNPCPHHSDYRCCLDCDEKGTCPNQCKMSKEILEMEKEALQ